MLAFFLVLAIGMMQAGPRGGGPALPIMLAIVVLIAPVVITAMRNPFRRERFLTFVIGGVLAAYLLESSAAWAITLGLA